MKTDEMIEFKQYTYTKYSSSSGVVMVKRRNYEREGKKGTINCTKKRVESNRRVMAA